MEDDEIDWFDTKETPQLASGMKLSGGPPRFKKARSKKIRWAGLEVGQGMVVMMFDWPEERNRMYYHRRTNPGWDFVVDKKINAEKQHVIVWRVA